MVLYHGSNVEVVMPEIRPLVRALDFGQGFYLTSSEDQAMKRSLACLKFVESLEVS